MATIAANSLLNGFRGKLGGSIVFKNWKNKTIVASAPRPTTKQSDRQRFNRSKFREASNWAHIVLLDPQRKTYYQKKAKKLHLPNAYTAAITDYMRTPRLQQLDAQAGLLKYRIYKKDFAVKEVKVKIASPSSEAYSIRSNTFGEYFVFVEKSAPDQQVTLVIADDTGREVKMIC